jgi:hypothetical protein
MMGAGGGASAGGGNGSGGGTGTGGAAGGGNGGGAGGGAQQPCGPPNCSGCCRMGACVPGSATPECGHGGVACIDCSTTGGTCGPTHACQWGAGGGTGGGGSAGTGGGSAGGGSASGGGGMVCTPPPPPDGSFSCQMFGCGSCQCCNAGSDGGISVSCVDTGTTCLDLSSVFGTPRYGVCDAGACMVPP